MSTKGPSNRYGNSRGGRQGHATKHTGFAWAKGFNNSSLPSHYGRHGQETNANSVTSYAAKAVKFANTIDRKNNVSFVDKKGSTYKFNKSTGEMAIITKKGVVVTYFKPKGGYQYYLKQKKARSR